MSTNRPFMVFSGTRSRYLAEQISEELGCTLGNMIITHFADGEFAVSYEESVRGKDVFLVQSTFPNSDNLMELLLMIDAAQRASAQSIIARYGWLLQDTRCIRAVQIEQMHMLKIQASLLISNTAARAQAADATRDICLALQSVYLPLRPISRCSIIAI